jgi:radical SAM superfamily enzyme YgiQ (UPF0313 family)
MKKILFVNVINNKIKVQKSYFPLSFGYLVSYAEAHGCKLNCKYTESLNMKILKTFNPDVVCLTSITENFERAKQYAALTKKASLDIKVIIGGIHISSVPKSLSSDMDIGVIGEGEQTFLELIQNNFEPSEKTTGLVYWNNGQIIVTPERSLIEPLDSIPHPKRDIFLAERRQPYLFTSRGCTYKCAFCSSSRYWKKTRFHSAEYIFEEVKQLISLGYHSINIYDDCFPLNVPRARKVSELVKDLDVTFSLSIRANLVTDEMAFIMKDMHVTDVGMGLESNSQRILDYLHKGNTVQDNQRAVDILRKYGFRVHCSFIRDIEIETKADLKLTYDFIRRNKLSYDMYRLMKFPNTPIYEGSENWDICKVQKYRHGVIRHFVHATIRRLIRLSKKSFIYLMGYFSYLLLR